MKDMTIAEFCDKHGACKEGREWASARCPSGMMSEAYAKLCEDDSEETRGYFVWTWLHAFDDKTLRLMAVRFIRETPLADGRKVVDLLTDPRSLAALDVAERYANGQATKEELAAAKAAIGEAAWDAAGRAAGRAAGSAAWAAGSAAGAAGAAAREAGAAAREAQRQIVLSYGNPFEKEGTE